MNWKCKHIDEAMTNIFEYDTGQHPLFHRADDGTNGDIAIGNEQMVCFADMVMVKNINIVTPV